ncbi:unnamed protein product [Schistocephalus solidus]|uniref:Serpin domain-containing protein n=1 Tax=Schistocephalus solidus TaxID=70667 RepID=A0A3P7C331_SCHSO|nr:unnamed protein product [Schistocephalus solidus]
MTLLFRTYCILGCSKNIVFSPASIYSAFSILLAGTAGETEKEIEKALHVTHEKDQTKLHKSIAKDLANLTGSTPETKVCMANKIFLDKGFPIKSAYSSLVSGCYALTFSDSETSRAHINQWVKEKTEQKIEELFPANSINNQTKMVIANAVYFKGKSLQNLYVFGLYLLKSPTQKMIWRPRLFAFLSRSPGIMFILLPNQENGLPQLLKKLFTVGPTPDGCGDKRYLDMFLSSMYYYTQEVNLYLPRFKIGEDDPSINLVDYMRKLGVSKIFNHSVADFSGLTDVRNLCVSSVLHRAVLEVSYFLYLYLLTHKLIFYFWRMIPRSKTCEARTTCRVFDALPVNPAILDKKTIYKFLSRLYFKGCNFSEFLF